MEPCTFRSDFLFNPVAGSAQNLAVIAVPDSKYAAAIVYQRMGTVMMDDMVVFSVCLVWQFCSIRSGLFKNARLAHKLIKLNKHKAP